MFAMSDQLLHSAHRPMLPSYGKWKSSAELAPNCPRCASANTKFCYYNNYSLSQPRYFCKGCRRYWTKGGSLRNVPVGGGCCKTRRGKSSKADKNQLRMNYSKNSTSSENQVEQIIGTSSSSGGDSSNQPGAVSTGLDIDLAVIFAQFVNQSTSSDQPEILSQEWPNDPWRFLEQDSNIKNDSSMEVPVVHPIPESYMLQGNDETNAFGLQNELADEMVHDVFWSNYAADTPSFECQPMVQQLQQFESFPVDDQLKISANLMSDNWSSFDLSGFDLYSKP